LLLIELRYSVYRGVKVGNPWISQRQHAVGSPGDTIGGAKRPPAQPLLDSSWPGATTHALQLED
jgi:hypothetical protein